MAILYAVDLPDQQAKMGMTFVLTRIERPAPVRVRS